MFSVVINWIIYIYIAIAFVFALGTMLLNYKTLKKRSFLYLTIFFIVGPFVLLRGLLDKK